MVKISISDCSLKSVVLELDSASVSMISRFLHYMCYADNSFYVDSDKLIEAVSEFYDSDYDSSMLMDARILENILDYAVKK